MTCNPWDVVTIPFPFTDRAAQKKRPAVVLSKHPFNQYGFTVMAMITTSGISWPGDSAIQDLDSVGLHTPCLVRLKLFTLDNRLIVRRLGQLGKGDQERALSALKDTFPLFA